MKTVQIVPISTVSFEPYGMVFGEAIDGVRRDNYDAISNLRASARINLAQVRADDRTQQAEITVDKLERHEFSSQSFFPLDVERYLIVVCKSGADGCPDEEELLAFDVPGNVGITYKPGVWHMGIGVLEGAGNFLMVVHEDGSPGDCEFVGITPTRIALSTA